MRRNHHEAPLVAPVCQRSRCTLAAPLWSSSAHGGRGTLTVSPPAPRIPRRNRPGAELDSPEPLALAGCANWPAARTRGSPGGCP
jgi:hypothetical protein